MFIEDAISNNEPILTVFFDGHVLGCDGIFGTDGSGGVGGKRGGDRHVLIVC